MRRTTSIRAGLATLVACAGVARADVARADVARADVARATVVIAELGRAAVAGDGFDFVHGVNEQTAAYLPLMPPMRGDVEAEFHTHAALGGRRPYVNVGTELVVKQTRLGPFDEQTAPYALLHLGGGIEYTVAGRSLAVDLRVRNALNTPYNNFLSRYKGFAYEQGRNLVLRVSMGL